MQIPTNLGTANDFNLFILGDNTQANTDCEGRMAIAGNLTLSNYGVGSALTTSTTRADLIVGGTMNVTGGENFHGNTVISLRNNVLRYTMTNANGVGGQPLEGTPIHFSAETAYLLCASASWATLSPNGSAVVKDGGLTLTGTEPSLNIFQFDAANVADSGISMAGLNRINIQAPAGSTILINVTGTVAGFGSYSIFRNGIVATGKDGTMILWNLPDVVTLQANTTSIKGSVLAPKATYVAGYSNIEGTLVLHTLIGNVESHHYPFLGVLPEPDCGKGQSGSGSGPDPEPGTDPSPVPCAYRQSANDVLESIALEQTALSHILNAEGEKIQKAVAMDMSVDMLLKINESVRKTINAVTALETTLIQKTETARELCSG